MARCCAVVERAAFAAREKRENRTKAQPWVVRKCMIPMVVGIIGYAAYAYISRLCLPMIENRAGSRTTGIVLLVVFSILYLWIIWAYIKIILTHPGFAKDHVKQSGQPPYPDSIPVQPDTHTSTSVSQDVVENDPDTSQRPPTTTIAGPSYDDLLRRDLPPQQLDPGTGEETQPPSTVRGDSLSSRRAEKQKKEAEREKTLDNLNVFRRPPTTPSLLPAYRYCYSDKLVKPYRAHHCRACGTCVLKYDHHCPWIGQCVGARNAKFFINFCFSTCLFTSFVFSTVLAFGLLKGMEEPQLIVLAALAAIFWLFTVSLVVSNVKLMVQGQTTVESMYIRGMREREERVLARGFAWWEFSEKKKRRRRFDREWGALNTEANIWWRGNGYDEWVDVMGKHWLGWMFPIGRSLSDGLAYPVNPRFHPDGRWRRREEWPEELR